LIIQDILCIQINPKRREDEKGRRGGKEVEEKRRERRKGEERKGGEERGGEGTGKSCDNSIPVKCQILYK
jgi:hypothetical protein